MALLCAEAMIWQGSGRVKSAIALLVLVSVLGLTAGAAENGKSAATISQPLVTLPAAPDNATGSAPSPVVLPSAPSLASAAQPAPALLLIKPQRVENVHRFFDMQNVTALAALGVALTGDALSTQKGLGLPGFHEMNPLARPFVQNRPGAAFYNAASFALIGGGMFLVHKTHHHRLERILPLAIAGWEGFLAARNYHLISSSTTSH
jgi:hypothetical protein